MGVASTVLPEDTEVASLSLFLSLTRSISSIFILLSSFTTGLTESSVTILILGTLALMLYISLLFFLCSWERENKIPIGPFILLFATISFI